ncbi:MAG: hypothetical protein ACKOQ4_03150 [Mycobacterium sp.]
MGFFWQWIYYLSAFLAGSALAWVIAVLTVHRTSRDEAVADLPAGSREIRVR